MKTFRARLLFLVILAILPALGLILFTAFEQRKQASREVENTHRMVRMLSMEQELRIESARQLLITLSRVPAVRFGDPERSTGLFAELLAAYPEYANIGAASADGDIYASGLPMEGPVNLADRSYAIRAIRNRGFAVGDYQVGRITHKASVNFGYPIFDEEGNFERLLFAALDLSWLNRAAARSDLPAGGILLVTDRNGTVLVRFPDSRQWVGREAAGSQIQEKMLEKKDGMAEAGGVDNRRRVFAFTPLGRDGEPAAYVAAGLPVEAVYGPAKRAMYRNLFLLLLAGGLALAAAWYGGEFLLLRPAQEELRRINESLERKVEERTLELERANRDLREFAYLASHDLQEPLRTVSNYVRLLERRYGSEADEEGRKYVRYVTEGVERMQRMIRDLLAYARAGLEGVDRQPVDFNEILDRVHSSLNAALEESGGEIQVSDLPALPADPSLMEQLFQNLVGNALKYRGDRPPRIEVSARREGEEWIFSVKDNGIGIDPKYFHQLFQPFKRLHNRSEYPGTGIGLAHCKKIVERHNGRVWVESQPGEGSVFCIALPA